MSSSSESGEPGNFKKPRLAGNGKEVGDVGSREECRYSSQCYRQNPAHLLQFRHSLLERMYGLMKDLNDFTKVPVGFDVGDGNTTDLIKQALILKENGFECATSPVGSPNTSGISGTSSSSSLGTSAKKDPLAELFEERKRKMRRIQDQLNESRKSQESLNSQSDSDELSSSRPKLSMSKMWELSCPYNLFLTKVDSIPEEKEGVLSASFADLFDPSLGEVKALIHINYMVEPNWVFDQSLLAGLEGKPTRIIYGSDNPELEEGAKAFPWLKIFKMKSPFPFGHHHTKMSIVQYADNSLRFLIYTANLIESDWSNRTQGIWISPVCPKLANLSTPADGVGDSMTKFRSDVMEYLATYPAQATAAWRDLIKYADCSAIRTFFVASAPSSSKSTHNSLNFGIKKMERILRNESVHTEPNWQLIAQCSSIGTLGASANDWLLNEFGGAMAGKDRILQGRFNLVYPTDENVKSSFEGVHGGGCLPYSARTHMKQRWLIQNLCQWKADRSGRSRAPPHIKSYSRWSPDQSKMAWFLLTSANLSKAAWGKLNKNGDSLHIMSWEAGVLFLPELITSTKYFTVNEMSPTTESADLKPFPLYYDIPLVKYVINKDQPWFFETLQIEFSE